jgi:tetratricopeptide (TPR) repeat protein
VSSRTPLAAGLLTTGLALTAAAAVLHARDARYALPEPAARLLYLQSGKTADRLFLNLDALGADLYWIRAIQHYGRDRRALLRPNRFELLQPLLDLTTTLDPHFNLAYRFGAIFLSVEPPNGPGRPDQAIALLEKGLAANPKRWQYAHDIGFIHYWYTGDYTAASQWFTRAADIPGAPEWLRPLAATSLLVGGDRQGARQLLTEMLSVDQEYIRHDAERGLAQLQALDAIDDLTALVDQYAARTGHPPRDWRDLIAAGLLPGIPLEQTSRQPYAYDPATHAVTLPSGSPLAPLPRTLRRH